MADLIQQLLFQLKAVADLTGVDNLNKKIAETDTASRKMGAQQARSLEGIAGAGKAAAVAATAVVGAMASGIATAKELADRTAQLAREQDSLVRTSGLYRENAAAIQYAGKQVGLSFEQQAQIANKLSIAVTTASEDQKAAFRDLKIDLDKLSPSARNVNAVFDLLVKNTKGLGDAGTRTAALTKIFGDDLQGKFQGVALKIEDARRKVKELGLVFDEQRQAQLALYRESVANVTAEFDAWAISMGTNIAPALSALIETGRNADFSKLAAGFLNPMTAAASFGKTLVELSGAYDRLNEQAAFDARVKQRQIQDAKNLKAIQDALTKSYQEQTAALNLQQQQINTRQGARIGNIKATASDDELVFKQRQTDAIRDLEKKFYVERTISQKEFNEQKIKIEQKGQDDLLSSQLKAARSTLASDKKANEELIANAEAKVRAIQEAHHKARFEGGVSDEGLKKLEADLSQAHINLEAAKTRATEQGATDRKALADLEEQQKQQSHQRELDRVVQEQAARKASSEQTAQDNARRTAKDQIDYETKRQQLLKQGLTEKQVNEELYYLKWQNLQREIAGLDSLIRSKSLEAGSEQEILELKKQRLALTGEIIAAEREAIEATDKAAGSAKEAGEAAEKGHAAFLSGIAALFAMFNQGILDAKNATAETIDEVLKQAEERFDGFLNAVYISQTSGLYMELAALASQAQQEAWKTRDRFEKERRDKEAEDLLKQQETDQKTAADSYKSYLDEKSNLDSDYAAQKRELEKSLRQLPLDQDKEELKSAQTLKEGLEALDRSRAEKLARQLEEETRSRVRAEQDALAGIAAAKNQAAQSGVSNQLSILDEEARAESDLRAASTPEEKKAAQEALDEISGRKERAARHDAEIRAAIARGESESEIKRLEGLFAANEDYLRRKREYEKLGSDSRLAELETLHSEQVRLLNEAAELEKAAAATKAEREKEDRARAIAEEQSEHDRAKQALLDRNQEEITSIRSKYAEKESELKASLAREKTEHEAALTALETRTAEAFGKMSAAAQAYFQQLKDGFASLPSGAPGTGGTPAPAPSEGGPEAGPSNQPAPGAGTPPPPSRGTQPGGLKDKVEATAARAFIDSVYRLIARLQSEPGLAAGIVTDLKALIGKTDEFLRSKGISSKDRLFLVDIKQVLEFLISQTAQPDTTTGPAKTKDKPTEGSQTQGQTGAVGTTPPKPKNTDTTVPTGGQKQAVTEVKRDETVANNLVFQAETFKDEAGARQVLKAAQDAKTAGKIDEDDWNRFKARFDKHAFDIGVPITAGAADFVRQTNDRQAAAKALQGAVSPAASPVAPTGPAAPVAPTPAAGGPSVVVNGGIHGSSQDKILTEMGKALDQAGIP